MHRPNPSCVVKVGDGRGFIVIHRVKVKLSPLKKNPRSVLERGGIFFREHRIVITAAHCLPHLPPPHASGGSFDRIYKCLLGSLDGSKKGIWAECLFADPVADIAVLGCPDANLEDEYEAYYSLTGEASFLRIGTAKSGPGWVLSIGGRWIRSTLEMFSGMGGESLWIDPTEAGMSGSPILNDKRRGSRHCGDRNRNCEQKRRTQKREIRATTNPRSEPSRMAIGSPDRAINWLREGKFALSNRDLSNSYMYKP